MGLIKRMFGGGRVREREEEEEEEGGKFIMPCIGLIRFDSIRFDAAFGFPLHFFSALAAKSIATLACERLTGADACPTDLSTWDE